MEAFKIMPRDLHNLGDIVLTTKVNYGSWTGRFPESKALADAVIEVCSESEITFSEAISTITALQSPFIRDVRLPPSMTMEQAAILHPLAESAPPLAAEFGGTFWEALYERVRHQERPTCPSRQKSSFACRELGQLRDYCNAHKQNQMYDKLACEIDITGCEVAFDVDTSILDAIDGSMTYQTARPHILRYWDQSKTSSPIMEILLQGQYVLGKVVEL
jgi:hypothetical protein